jgi:hypothetical protein
MEGFAVFHRKMVEWQWYTDSNTFRLFFHLILMANHKENNWKNINVKRGQIVTGRKSLAKELKLSEQQIRTSIDKLISTNEITIKPTNKFTLVTIVNYDLYQSIEKNQPTNQPSSQPTNNQQITTNNNDNNDNNLNIGDLPHEKQLKQHQIEVFEYWNNKKIHVHQNITESIKSQLLKVTISVNKDLKEAIDNYSIAYNDSSYFYKHKWTLDKFIKQSNGYKEWLNDGSSNVAYSSRKITNKQGTPVVNKVKVSASK